MIEVAGVWEDGWNTPLTESVQWEMMMREYGVTQLNMTPVSGIAAPWGSKPWISEYPSIDDMLKDKDGLEPVYVTEDAVIDLEDFVHPENALYIFGRAGYSPPVPDGAKSVMINNPTPGCLWAHQACAVVLYFRFRTR